jgi:predicted DNA-binding transcriptional regulator AlpA
VPVPREALLELIADGNGTGTTVAPVAAAPATWRERLWTCPPDTRLGVREVAEALGRPKSWVYRAVAAKRGPLRLPATRFSGELSFTAGAVRDWLTRQESRAVGPVLSGQTVRRRVRGRFAERPEAKPLAGGNERS